MGNDRFWYRIAPGPRQRSSRQQAADLPEWKVRDRQLAGRARAVFPPRAQEVPGDSEVMYLYQGTGKPPRAYVRRRPNRAAEILGGFRSVTLPWRRVTT